MDWSLNAVMVSFVVPNVTAGAMPDGSKPRPLMWIVDFEKLIVALVILGAVAE